MEMEIKEMEIKEEFFKFLLAEILEEILRLEKFIYDVREQVPEKPYSVLSIFDESIGIISSKFLEEISKLRRRLDSFDEVDAYTQIRGIHKTFSRRIDKLHKSLSWIHAPWVEEETHRFLRELLLEAAKTKTVQQKFREEPEFTVVFSDDLNYLKHDIHLDLPDYQGLHASPVLALPKIDRNNPIMWTILIHEIGHIFAEHCKIIDPVFKELSKKDLPKEILAREDKQEMLKKWITEFTADAISLQLLGPASILPFIAFCLTSVYDNLNNGSDEHPPTTIRLEYLLDNLDTNIGINYKAHDELQKYVDFLYFRIKIDQKYQHLLPHEFELTFAPLTVVNEVAKSVYNTWWSSKDSKELDLFSKENYFISEKLNEHYLSKEMPVGSYCLRDKEKAISDIQQCEENGKIPDLAKSYNCLDQKPSQMKEIINAGWIHKREFQSELFNQYFRKENPIDSKELINTYRQKLMNYDELLQKSIEMSLIHKFYYEKLQSFIAK